MDAAGQGQRGRYRPTKCKKTYRVIALRQNLSVEKGEWVLLDDVRWFSYITNDWKKSPAEIVFEANGRCKPVAMSPRPATLGP